MNYVSLCLLLLMPTYSVAAPAVFEGSTIQSVEDFIRTNAITSLEDFLPHLSQELRSNFILMRKSSSLQPTNDALKPRAILFGEDAKLVFAFNHSSNSLEIMQQPAAGEKFHFKRINFFVDKPITTQTNCQGCHRGRPLWGQYRSWAGMYGGDQEFIPANSPEAVDYLAFLKLAKTDTLYKNLIFKCNNYSDAGTAPGFLLKNSNMADLPACTTATDLDKGSARLQRRLLQPAEAFGELVNRMNAARLFAVIQTAPDYENLKYALAANSLGCLGTRIYDYNSGDSEALDKLRHSLKELVKPIEARIGSLALNRQSSESTLQGQLLNLLGVQISKDLRLDIRFDSGKALGNDCELHQSYSPNPYCNPGVYGYESYSDGTDMAANLIAYQVLRDLFGKDPVLSEKLRVGLEATESYFSKLPAASNDSYARPEDVLTYLRPVLADLKNPSPNASGIPKYIYDYPFTQVIRWGDGEAICRALISKIP